MIKLRPWHYSLADRLNDRARRFVPYVHTVWSMNLRYMSMRWAAETNNRRPKRAEKKPKALSRY
jgi:hypothetical protein